MSNADAVNSNTRFARRRRDEHNPPKCAGGHFKQATDTFVGTRWPSHTAFQRPHAFASRRATMKCGNTASGDKNHHQGQTRPLEFPDRDCIVYFLEA